MSKQYEQPLRFSAVGLTTGAILTIIVAMAVSVAIDFLPVRVKLGTTASIAEASIRV
jgi:hypothetical protein